MVERHVDRLISKAINARPRDFTDKAGGRHLTVNGRDACATVDEFAGGIFVRVEAPVMPLPADRELIQPFMREALELNYSIPGHARLTTVGRILVSVAAQSVARLPPDGLEAFLEDAGLMAAFAAGPLSERFSGTTKTRGVRS